MSRLILQHPDWEFPFSLHFRLQVDHHQSWISSCVSFFLQLFHWFEVNFLQIFSNFIQISSTLLNGVTGECGFPGRPKFGSVRINETVVEPDGSTYESGTNATYWCDLPVETEDPSDRVCQPDGRWTGSVPECRKGIICILILILKIQSNFNFIKIY